MFFICIVSPKIAVQADDVFLSYFSIFIFFISDIDAPTGIDR